MAQKRKRILFGDEGTRRPPGRERDVFPAPVRPATIRLLWLGLTLVLLALAVLLVTIGRAL